MVGVADEDQIDRAVREPGGAVRAQHGFHLGQTLGACALGHVFDEPG